VFIGTFGRTYDLSTVISAARELNRQGDDQIQFVLCGHGERADEWRRAAAGLKNVVFPGWVDAAQWTYLQGLRTVGLAAYARNAPQSIPNKLFEYMSGGAPVLSSLQGEGAQFLKENSCGLTYMPGDPASFLSALADLRA
jgi:glycosyltransferase involved in cell wall biosynthesis